jgi:thiamine pyrophosphate-dependent acetolactate synthase large subunit-like protein
VTGGDLLVRGLEACGVDVAFGLPGVHNLPAWKALARSGIRLVGVRHEQTAVYAADGFARATGRPGIAITTTGPGAANTLGALGEAWASGSPVVVVATDIPTALRRPGVYRGALHEATDQEAMFKPVTKHTMRVADPSALGQAIVEAYAIALAPPTRPVYLEVPTDVLSAAVEEPAARVEAPPPYPAHSPPEKRLREAADLIERAERPLIWAGGGALRAGAREAVAELAERLSAPVITTYMARGLLGTRHPCAVGLPPHLPEVGRMWDEADVVIAIGTDFDGMMTQNWAMPQPPALVAVNVDAADASKNYHPDLVLEGDASSATAELARLVEPRGRIGELAQELAELRSRVRERLREEYPAEIEFLDAFERAVPADALVVADMCIPGYWLGGFHPVPGPRRLAYPMGWGTLGFGFPLAIGSALAGVAPVVSVAGDGGFLYAVGELATVAQERIPLTQVIVDDGGYGMLRFDQRQAGDPTFGVDLDSPDFETLARSFRVDAETVEGLGDEFAEALARHAREERPTVLVARAALEPPPTTSPRWYRREH